MRLLLDSQVIASDLAHTPHTRNATMPNLILTTCGTSILTNGFPEQRALFAQVANHREADLSSDQLATLEVLRVQRNDSLDLLTPPDAAKASAELNGILAHYALAPSEEQKRRDVHVLLASDTYLGRMTRDLAAHWLRGFGFAQVVPLDVTDLRTSSLEDFRAATADLTVKLEELTHTYRSSGHRIHFNLTGGFKSVNAFIQLLGSLWADEVFFVFESSSELIRIPRLPFRLDDEGIIREHLATFRRLVVLNSEHLSTLTGFPDGLLLVIGDEACLSPWAEAAFAARRTSLYGEAVHPSWTDGVRFGPSFLKSTAGLPPDRLRLINERIDDLARLVHTGHNIKRLDLKPIKGKPQGDSTHEADAWSDGSADRLFLHKDSQVWTLDRLGPALH